MGLPISLLARGSAALSVDPEPAFGFRRPIAPPASPSRPHPVSSPPRPARVRETRCESNR